MVGTIMVVFVLISQTIKSLLREPRPLMVDKEIWVNDCKHMEFGNPSSHTFGSSYMFISATYLMIKHYVHKNKYKATVLTILGPLNLVFCVVGLIGFSRVFKGVHSYNQVLSGFMQGAILAMIQCFILYEEFFVFYMRIRTMQTWELVVNNFTIVYSIIVAIGIYVHF
jgi:hypothetical protein